MNLQLKTVKEFLAEKPNLTVCGLAWAVTWRFIVMYMVFWVAFMLIFGSIGFLFDL